MSIPSKPLPPTSLATVISSIRSKLIGGWSDPSSLPTKPGHIALCNFQDMDEFIIANCELSI